MRVTVSPGLFISFCILFHTSSFTSFCICEY